MKSLFARHQEKLAERERNEIWERVRAPREPAGAPRWLRLAPAAGLLFAVVAVTLVVRHPRPVPTGPTPPQLSVPPPTSAETAPGNQESGPAGNVAVEPATGASSARQGVPAAGPGDVASASENATAPGTWSEHPGTSTTPPVDGEVDVAQRPPEPRSAPPREATPAAPLPIQVTTDVVGLKSGVVAREGELRFRGGRNGESQARVEKVPVPSLHALETVVDLGTTAQGAAKDGRSEVQTWGALRDQAVGAPSTALSVAPMQRNGVPVIPYTGGNALPNDEPYDAMLFEHYGVNPFIPTDEDALSTFAVDVDNASYTVMRRYVELGNLPPQDAVRLEEFVNFFPQGYPRFEAPDFRIFVDGAPSPFGRGYQLLRVGIKGRVIEERDRKPATLVFVIDTSGSMEREDRLELVKRALGILVDRLRDGDEVGIVVYGSRGRVLLDPVRISGDDEFAGDPQRRDEGDPRLEPGRGGDDERIRPVDDRHRPRGGRERVLRAIEELRPDGSTNAEEGLRLGYDLARAAYRPGAINRIILCSDGVANVGRTGPESILEEVRREADKGITLTAVGFGMGNFNDVLLEQLADRGDGNYYYVDDLEEARRVFLENLTGTLQIIAKDAKVQVEFDPKRVLRYRLLGFENRDVADRDFRNDKVDAGEIGAGHEVTALYEVKLADGVERGPIATVRFRYARPERERGRGPEVEDERDRGERDRAAEEPGTGSSRRAIEIERTFDTADLHREFGDASPEFRLDAAVAEYAEILRKSYWAKESRIEDVLRVARRAADDLGTEEAEEFMRILRKAEGLSDKVEPQEYK